MYVIAVNKSLEFLLNVRRLFLYIFFIFRRRRKGFDFDDESMFFGRRRTLAKIYSACSTVIKTNVKNIACTLRDNVTQMNWDKENSKSQFPIHQVPGKPSVRQEPAALRPC